MPLHARLSQNGWTPVILASANGAHAKCLKLLIDHGCDLNAKNVDGDTSAMHACRSNSETAPDCLQLLVDAGIELDATNEKGDSALKIATDKLAKAKKDSPELKSATACIAILEVSMPAGVVCVGVQCCVVRNCTQPMPWPCLVQKAGAKPIPAEKAPEEEKAA